MAEYDTAPHLAMDREGAEFAYDSALYVQFDKRPMLDELLSYGWQPGVGPEKFTISKNHPRFKELEKLGRIEGPDPDLAPTSGMYVVTRSEVPHYKTVEFITIRRRGTDIMDQLASAPEFPLCEHPSNRRCPVVPSGQCHKVRFRRQYDDWKAGVDADAAGGMPLSEVPFIDPARREQLTRTGVKTAEQLVALPDDLAGRMPGMLQLRERTRRFLDALAGKRQEEQLQKQLAERDDRIAELTKRLASLESATAAVQEQAKRR